MKRIWSIFLLFILFDICVFFRLFYWQVIASDRLKNEAASQHLIRMELPASRGDIVTADGYPLVINQNAYLIFGEPKNIENIEQFSRSVGEILSIDPASISAQLHIPDRLWVPIQHKVEEQKVQELQKLELKGIGFEKEPKRFYPESSMSAHLLGFIASDQNGQDKGYFGLEGYYDRELKGKNGSLSVERDVTGAPILIGETIRVEPEDGRMLVLWMDRSIQRIVEERLKEGLSKYGAKSGSVIVMEPSTGGILAMASYPSYSPGEYWEYPKEFYANPVVNDGFEPGSIIKPLIMALGIEKNAVTPETTMEETGAVEVSGYRIKTWNDQYHGHITMTDVLKNSSNVGMVFVQKRLKNDAFLSAIRDFGFGSPTDIDLEDEQSPSLRSDKEWREIDYATASFGQGIAVTPIQMIRAMATIANGGYLMEAKVVKEIQEDAVGKITEIQPKAIKRVFSEKTVKQVTGMMIEAVEGGDAKWAKPKGYKIAGKTGTAQIPVEGVYDEKKTIASFIGFAPADNPRFIMLVTLHEPSSSQWGSETAAPLFFSIVKDIFLYLGIPPS